MAKQICFQVRNNPTDRYALPVRVHLIHYRMCYVPIYSIMHIYTEALNKNSYKQSVRLSIMLQSSPLMMNMPKPALLSNDFLFINIINVKIVCAVSTNHICYKHRYLIISII
jgi:hypothetical protein